MICLNRMAADVIDCDLVNFFKVFKDLNINSYKLNVDILDVHAVRTTFSNIFNN